MSIKIKGKVWKFGDDISTDLMAPGYSEHKGFSEAEEALFCMNSNRPEWAKQVKTGDIIVGGKNFGCGSSRLNAPRNVKLLGIGCVAAESFGRIFFRNCIGLGLPVIECHGVHGAFDEGDILEADVKLGVVKNLTTGNELKSMSLPDITLKILEAGGIIPMLRSQYIS